MASAPKQFDSLAHSRTALAVMAHPDDVEFMCAGTLALLQQQGWEIHIATLTAGDAGSEQLGPGEIARIRRREAARAAAVLHGRYHCLECLDGFIAYDRPTLLKVIRVIREARPAIVFAPSPVDYLVDHEVVSALARNAVFLSSVPNVKTGPFAPHRPIPCLYYADAVGGHDPCGGRIEPSLVVDISQTIKIKARMLACHASQRDWLRQQHGLDEYIDLMRKMSAERGQVVQADFGEGFRQHLGHGYPDTNLLERELGELVFALPPKSLPHNLNNHKEMQPWQ
jgi:LmbE family N-acetylglucosaminyl deacetylase